MVQLKLHIQYVTYSRDYSYQYRYQELSYKQDQTAFYPADQMQHHQRQPLNHHTHQIQLVTDKLQLLHQIPLLIRG